MRAIVIDTETAGLDPKDGIVDLAIVEIDGNLDVIASHASLIDPEGPISTSASGVHGIVSADVADSPTLCQFFDMEGPGDYCEAALYAIGHNVQFDLRFLAEHLRGEIVPICTLRLARRLYPDVENHKLQTLRYEFGLEAGAGNSHSAYSDTILALSLLRRIAEDTGSNLAELAHLSALPIRIERMPFGKHKDTPLDKLPSNYRSWLLEKAEIDDDLRWSLTN